LGTDGTFPVIFDSCGEKYEETSRLSPYFKCGVKMRYEVRQQDEKWIVWDTLNDCAMKGVAGLSSLSSLTAANCMRHPSIAGLLVMKPNSVASLAAEARPLTFWTQKEAQVCVDTLNDIDQLGSV